MKHNRALDAAIALSQAPTLSTVMRAQELPTGVNLLLRILVGDADALSEARNLTGLRDKDLLVIAELYVLKVMLYRGASARRILGVGFGADRREMRQHMGWLLAWLHPDRNPGAWRAAFARLAEGPEIIGDPQGLAGDAAVAGVPGCLRLAAVVSGPDAGPGTRPAG